MKLTIIGTGKMAEAIIKGTHLNFEVEVVGRSLESLEKLKKLYNIKLVHLVNYCSIEGKNIILCIKPYVLKEVSQKLKGEAFSLLSVLAGTALSSLKQNIKADHYVRIMPNLAASYGKSMSTLCGDLEFKDEAIKICQCFGKTLWLGSEKEIDIATAVAGSGPAFLALIAEALSDGGVKEGLKREDADILVRGLFEGFSFLLDENHPALLKDAVMSPGGTTAAGYTALEEGAVRSSFINAIVKAYEKTKG